MARLGAALDFLSLPNACPLCVVVLNPQNGHAIAANSTFETIFGPLYKFKEWDFANAATGEDIHPGASSINNSIPHEEKSPEQEDGEENKNRDKFKSAIGKVRASLLRQEDGDDGNSNGGKGVAGSAATSARVRNIEMLTLGTNEVGLPIRHHFDWTIGSMKGNISSGDEEEDVVILYGDMVNEMESSNRARDTELIDFFQNAPIAMHWLNGDGIVLWANQTELNVLGYTAEEYIGKPIMNFCPDEQELVLEIFKQLGSGNAIADVPVRFRTKDGKLVYLLIDSNVAYNKDGSFGHTRCFIRDDTARKIRDARHKLLLEETERSLRMLDGFLSRTLHHVMGPLHALKVTCEVVRDKIIDQQQHNGKGFDLDHSKADKNNVINGEDEAEKNCELLERAADTVMTTTRMVADVADLARFDEGANLKTKFKHANLREVGAEAIESIQFNALRLTGGDDGISVSLKLVGVEGGPAAVSTDQGVLLRVLAHLLDNAVREVDCGGQVMLQITSTGGSNGVVLVEITDDGKGLPSGTCLDQGVDSSLGGGNNKDKDGTSSGTKRAPVHRYVIGNRRLYSDDPDQIQKARVEMEEKLRDLKQNGVGVGLPLSYHLVRALGGDLRHDHQYNSTGKKGTRIWFALPSRHDTEEDKDGDKMEINDDVSVLKSEMILKKGIQPPASITFDLNNNPNKRMRTGDADFANFSSDSSATSGSETVETSMTPALKPEAVAKCGVKASMPLSVLIVEDTDICARLLAMQLKKMKCSTQRAENGQVAVDLLRDSIPGTFDMVLMDLRMPVMDGLEATKLIRNELQMKDLPIVALTGEMSADIRSECEQIGFDDFFQKPVKRDKLQELVTNYKDMRDGVK